MGIRGGGQCDIRGGEWREEDHGCPRIPILDVPVFPILDILVLSLLGQGRVRQGRVGQERVRQGRVRQARVGHISYIGKVKLITR